MANTVHNSWANLILIIKHDLLINTSVGSKLTHRQDGNWQNWPVIVCVFLSVTLLTFGVCGTNNIIMTIIDLGPGVSM